jgi:hypothetical protein
MTVYDGEAVRVGLFTGSFHNPLADPEVVFVNDWVVEKNFLGRQLGMHLAPQFDLLALIYGQGYCRLEKG